MADKTPKAPIWYDKAEVAQWLRREDHEDLVNFLTYHFQKAFEKGYGMGYRQGQREKDEANQ